MGLHGRGLRRTVLELKGQARQGLALSSDGPTLYCCQPERPGADMLIINNFHAACKK